MPKVSVVVPTYNNERYLNECIDSILEQTLYDIEIIVVNDGSTDSTSEILSQYACTDERIKVINIPNGGYGHAVNIGFEASRGEYIGIVESDDYVQSDMYEKLYSAATLYDCDLIKADYRIFVGDDGDREFTMQNICPKELYGRVLNPLTDPKIFDSKLYTWAGIYKKRFLLDNEVMHHESKGASYQDNGFWFQVITSANRIMFIDYPLYNLRRDNPASSIMSKDKALYICEEYKFIYERVYGKGTVKKEFLKEFWYRRYKAYNVHLKRIGSEHRLAFLERFSQDFHMARRKNELFPELFSENDWNMVQMILADYKVAYIYIFQGINELNEYIKEKVPRSVYIADEMGRRIFGQLFRDDRSFNFEQIVISNYKVLDKRRKLETYHGYKVTLFHRVHNAEKHDAFLLCSAGAKWAEEIPFFRDKKFSQIIPVSQNYLSDSTITISVIITIFNKKTYLRNCIESVINQKYHNLEIILVDDGSTDGSAEICDEYVKKDSRITVIHKQNEGLVSARKSGINIASGKYITYVDADDWIEDTYYEKVYWRMVENDADIIATGYIKEDGKEVREVRNNIESGYYEKDELLKEVYCKMLYSGGMYKFGISQYVWNKFYKKDILTKNQMAVDESIVTGEDVACVYPCLLEAKSIDVFNICQYHYIIYPDSMSRICDDYLADNAFKLYAYLKERFACSVHHEILQWQLSHYIVYLCQVGAKSAYGIGNHADYPFDFGKFSCGQKVILIAGGQRGLSYYKQLMTTPICELLEWVKIDLDSEYRDIEESEWKNINEAEADLIVIGTDNLEFFQKMHDSFMERGFVKHRVINVS